MAAITKNFVFVPNLVIVFHSITNMVSKPMFPSLGDRSVDTDTFARVHSNARTVHPL